MQKLTGAQGCTHILHCANMKKKSQQNVSETVTTSVLLPSPRGILPPTVPQQQNLLSADRCAKHGDGDDIWGLLQAICVCVCQCVHEGSNRSTLNDVRNLKTLKNNALIFFFFLSNVQMSRALVRL